MPRAPSSGSGTESSRSSMFARRLARSGGPRGQGGGARLCCRRPITGMTAPSGPRVRPVCLGHVWMARGKVPDRVGVMQHELIYQEGAAVVPTRHAVMGVQVSAQEAQNDQARGRVVVEIG